MMTILHGENISASRAALSAFRDKFSGQETMTLDGRKTNLSQIKQVLESPSMFTVSRLVVIENLLSTKKSPGQQEIIDYLLKEPVEVELVLWEEKEIGKTLLSKFEKAEVSLFKLEQVMFKFLESLRPNNQKESLTLFRSFKKEEPEIIFYMLIRQLRMLLAIKDETTSGLEELDRLAPWQKERLTRQAKYFTQENLFKHYHELLQIDYEQKTGQNSFNLGKTLEIFILNV